MIRLLVNYLKATLRRWLDVSSAAEVHALCLQVAEHRALEHLRSRQAALVIEGDMAHLQVITAELAELQLRFGERA